MSPPPPPPVAVTAVPRLHPKARLQHDDVRGRDVLLYPQRYGAPAGTVKPDVSAFLDGLAAKGLVTYGP